MRRLQKAASSMGARLFRQNAGMAWVGNVRQYARPEHVLVRPGDVVVRNARPFHAGVTGMSDLGGWVPVEITPDMVGTRIAIYTAVEVKTDDGRASGEQEAFIAAVRKAGGRAGIARNDGDLTAILSGQVDATR